MSTDALFDEVGGQFGTKFVARVFTRNDAPETSRQAAKKVKPTAGKAKERVFNAIRLAGVRGMTDKEVAAVMAELFDMPENTARPRRVDLANEGRIVVTNVTRNGGRVWVAADFPRSEEYPALMDDLKRDAGWK